MVPIPDLTLRERSPEDVPALGRLLVAQQPTSGYPVVTREDPAAFVVRANQFAAWVAEIDGELAGHVALASIPPTATFAATWTSHYGQPVETLCGIAALFVGPGRQGLGLGGLLFDHAVAEAGRRGRQVVLDTVDCHGPALDLYHRRGWRVVGHVPVDWLPAGLQSVAMVPPEAG